MVKLSELGDELHALKSELSHLMSAPADGMFDAAKSRSDALVEQMKDT
jgi:hypothetical protein